MARFDAGQGRTVYFEHHRGSGTPVVLIHGWAMSGRIWASTAEALRADGHAVLIVDHRGCGQSDRDFEDMSVAAIAADVAGIVRQECASPAVLNGWSLGGAVAVEAARLLGDRAAGVVLTCGASPRFVRGDDFPYGGEPGSLDATAEAIAADRAGFFRGLAEGVCARPVSAPTVDWMWNAFIDSGVDALKSLRSLAATDQREVLASLAVPLISIVGTADVILDPEIGRIAARLAPQGQVTEMDGCGHAPFIEDAPAYLAALRGFLARL
jgi:non-heme chloroperoxidase